MMSEQSAAPYTLPQLPQIKASSSPSALPADSIVARLYQSYAADSPAKRANPTQQSKKRLYYSEGGLRTPDKADNHVASSSAPSPLDQIKKRRAQAAKHAK